MRRSNYYNHGLFRGVAKRAEIPAKLRKGFPVGLSNHQIADFLAGYIEECGYFNRINNESTPTFIIIDDDEAMLQGIVDWAGVQPSEREAKRFIRFTG